MLTTPLDFKEKMIEARRTQILMGAAQVFAQKGFHSATTKEIAQAAEVAEGTIYNYFSDKRALLAAMIELAGAQSFNNIIPADLEVKPETFLTQLLHNFQQLLQERGRFAVPILAELLTDPDLRQIYYREIIKPATAAIERYLRRQAETGHLRRTDLTIATQALLGAALLNFVLHSANLDTRYSQRPIDDIVQPLVSLLLDGLHPDDELNWLIS